MRARLLMDLTRDLCRDIPDLEPPRRRSPVDGGPRFDFLGPHRPRPEALAAGTLTSMLMLASFTLLFQPRVFPPAPLQLGEGSGVNRRGSHRATQHSK